MSRGKKLLIVGCVLVAGFVLAWPFRKTADDSNLAVRSISAQPMTAQREPLEMEGQTESVTRQPPAHAAAPLGLPRAPHVVAKMAKIEQIGPASLSQKLPRGTHRAGQTAAGSQLRGSQSSQPIRQQASFDLANHPALAGSLGSPAVSPVTPPVPPQVQVPYQTTLQQQERPAARPAYATVENSRIMPDARDRERDELRHVVQNSDTLEKLAKRYLGDEGRALEIFDINRDVLDNPHLLPIEAELRIPRRGN